METAYIEKVQREKDIVLPFDDETNLVTIRRIALKWLIRPWNDQKNVHVDGSGYIYTAF